MKNNPISIEKLNSFKKDELFNMMNEFYSSPAVFTNGSKEIFEADLAECLKGDILEGYFIKHSLNIIGYFMITKAFSTEFGKPVIWLEDLYIKKDYRYNHYSDNVFEFIEDKYPDSIIKLEVEKDNLGALYCYKRNNFTELPYIVMVKKQCKK